MRWPWQKKPKSTVFDRPPGNVYKVPKNVVLEVTEDDPFIGSPFNAEKIGPGDPGWEILNEVLVTGKPVHGGYDSSGRVWIDDGKSMNALGGEPVPEKQDATVRLYMEDCTCAMTEESFRSCLVHGEDAPCG